MKRLFLLWVAKKLDKLKVNNMGTYLVIVNSLLAINGFLTHPGNIEVVEKLTGHSDMVRWAVGLFTTFVGYVINPRTNRFIQQEEGKRLSVAGMDKPTNGVHTVRVKRKRKFLGL
jgi:hypothetical protein